MPIEDLRNRIDEVDEKILKLLEKRIELAKKIGKVKKENGMEVYDPEREGKVLGRLTSKTKLGKDFIRKTFTSIIEYCRENE